mmetsp:Transcript_13979/g.30938  ORF Transcript_13979/g.30938 Transcript_13979/m.30938 type:complete len:308 (-) Transcript_13979:74-997(-)
MDNPETPSNVLRQDREELARNLLQAQQDMRAQEQDVKQLKEYFGTKLAALEGQVAEAEMREAQSLARCVYLEDKVRFFEEQTRMMAEFWKLKLDNKEQSIDYLHEKLKEVQAQPRDGMTEEHRCLQGRFEELEKRLLVVAQEKVKLTVERDERKAERDGALAQVQQLQSQLASARSDAHPDAVWVEQLEQENANLRAQVKTLEEAVHSTQPTPEPEHTCVWRSQLDIRVKQLERMSEQLHKTYDAYHQAHRDREQYGEDADKLRQDLASSQDEDRRMAAATRASIATAEAEDSVRAIHVGRGAGAVG